MRKSTTTAAIDGCTGCDDPGRRDDHRDHRDDRAVDGRPATGDDAAVPARGHTNY
ncbi:hypothetical protein [Halorubrum saccharovorum]|uniref:hypothetical protein n=1 Tax=Halorubrum saccharovorum TaxID=2248 RepID=UPI0019108808|nr:hypothetical protein [Halorubrum saccharovorum]